MEVGSALDSTQQTLENRHRLLQRWRVLFGATDCAEPPSGYGDFPDAES